MNESMKRLIISRMSVMAIPPGGGAKEALEFLSTSKNIADGWRKAEAWAREAIALIRTGQEPNPWKTASDDDIADEIMRRIDERKGRL